VFGGLAVLSLVAVGLGTIPASASHPEASLAGSNFEIDEDANLKLDDSAPSVDWGSLAHPNGPELRATDLATGQNDDSYKGGVKEDTECPDETTGSIPNNKSDLLTFHVYEEPGVGTHPGFLNLAWSRVSDPSGTTLMDFEFNQSEDDCAVGPNKVRTQDDLLIEYAIDQGGSRAEISGRFWDDTANAWGPSLDLDDGTACGGGPCAVGTINQSVIPAAESDGLGEKQPRTFGEAQIDLRLIFNARRVLVVRQRDAEEPVVGRLHLAAEGLHHADRHRPAELRERDHPQADRPGRGPEHDRVRLHQVVQHFPDVAEHVHAHG